jgi:hypothetical protein
LYSLGLRVFYIDIVKPCPRSGDELQLPPLVDYFTIDLSSAPDDQGVIVSYDPEQFGSVYACPVVDYDPGTQVEMLGLYVVAD